MEMRFLEILTREAEKPEGEWRTIYDIFVDEAKDKNSTILPILIEFRDMEKNHTDMLYAYRRTAVRDRELEDKLNKMMYAIGDIVEEKLYEHADFHMIVAMYKTYRRVLDTADDYTASVGELAETWCDQVTRKFGYL